MTDQELKAMQGTEFIYIFEDGDWMPAYVKKIDLEKNLATCWTFSLTSNDGYVFLPSDDDEQAEDAMCVCHEDSRESMEEMMRSIINYGILSANQNSPGLFTGCPF